MSAVHSRGQDADEKFFVVKGAPPNLMILLDTSGSMQDLPVPPNGLTIVDADDQQTNDLTDFTCDTTIPAYEAIATAGAFSMSGNYPPPGPGRGAVLLG